MTDSTPENRPRQPGGHARQVEVNGRQVWVLEDAAGIVEVADSKETLAHDHPDADLDGTGTESGPPREI